MYNFICAMFYFTSQEKSAIIKVANLMAMADGHLDVQEVVISSAIFSKLNATQSDITNARQMENQEALNIISSMQPHEKRLVVAILGSIMIADGKIEGTEKALICLITAICNLPEMSLADVKEEILKLD